MAGIMLGSGSVQVQMSDDLHRYVDSVLANAIPTLRPAMERLIEEARQEVEAAWPSERDRLKYERDKRKALAEAKNERRRRRKAGQQTRGISFQMFMPTPYYNPPGYRSYGKTAQAWRVEFRLESGPTLVANMYNDASKRGARYAYMAKLPPPDGNKTYFRTIAIKSIKTREKGLIDVMSKDMAQLLGAR